MVMVSMPALSKPNLRPPQDKALVNKAAVPQRTMHGNPDCTDAKGV